MQNLSLHYTFVSDPGVTLEKCKKIKHIHATITLQYSVPEKNSKVTNTTFIHQSKYYHVIRIKNWHKPERTNHHSSKVFFT